MSNKPSADFKVDWYRTAIPRDRLKELNRRSDAKGLLQSTSFFTLMLASGIVAFHVYRHFAWPWLILGSIEIRSNMPVLYRHTRERAPPRETIKPSRASLRGTESTAGNAREQAVPAQSPTLTVLTPNTPPAVLPGGAWNLTTILTVAAFVATAFRLTSSRGIA